MDLLRRGAQGGFQGVFFYKANSACLAGSMPQIAAFIGIQEILIPFPSTPPSLERFVHTIHRLSSEAGARETTDFMPDAA